MSDKDTTTSPCLVLGLPKGSLQEATFALMRKAGFRVRADARSYMPDTDDPELSLRLIRAQEISRYVENGHLDAGVTGLDWIVENGSDVHEVANLVYGKQGFRPVRWVLAVPNDSPIRKPEDVQGRCIATEAVGLTRKYLAERRIEAEVEFSWGATEVKVPDLADAIVELTETGSSLRAHNLRVVDTLMESTTRLIAGHTAWADSWKQKKIEQLATLLRGVLAAESRVLLKLNVHEDRLVEVLDQLPSLHAPTVNQLSQEGWYSVETVVEEHTVRELALPLKEAGAEGLIEIALNKVIP